MRTEEISINSNSFEFNGKKYDCELVVKRDKKLIMAEAEESHKEALETLYEKDSLAPHHVKLYVDDNNWPLYLMVVYIINYKDNKGGRYACGDYYPIDNGFSKVYPHPYQTSICW